MPQRSPFISARPVIFQKGQASPPPNCWMPWFTTPTILTIPAYSPYSIQNSPKSMKQEAVRLPAIQTAAVARAKYVKLKTTAKRPQAQVRLIIVKPISQSPSQSLRIPSTRIQNSVTPSPSTMPAPISPAPCKWSTPFQKASALSVPMAPIGLAPHLFNPKTP